MKTRQDKDKAGQDNIIREGKTDKVKERKEKTRLESKTTQGKRRQDKTRQNIIASIRQGKTKTRQGNDMQRPEEKIREDKIR